MYCGCTTPAGVAWVGLFFYKYAIPLGLIYLLKEFRNHFQYHFLKYETLLSISRTIHINWSNKQVSNERLENINRRR